MVVDCGTITEESRDLMTLEEGVSDGGLCDTTRASSERDPLGRDGEIVASRGLGMERVGMFTADERVSESEHTRLSTEE